jgi:hypothetical protein
MKFLRLISFFVVISLAAVGCATSGEPNAHVADCHTSDGLLVDSSLCRTSHEDIVEELRKTKAARQGKLEHGSRGSLR